MHQQKPFMPRGDSEQQAAFREKPQHFPPSEGEKKIYTLAISPASKWPESFDLAIGRFVFHFQKYIQPVAAGYAGAQGPFGVGVPTIVLSENQAEALRKAGAERDVFLRRRRNHAQTGPEFFDAENVTADKFIIVEPIEEFHSQSFQIPRPIKPEPLEQEKEECSSPSEAIYNAQKRAPGRPPKGNK